MNILDVINSPWAIVPEKLLEIQSIYDKHVLGEKVDLATVEASLGRPMDNRQRRGYSVHDGVAIIPLQGVIAKKANVFHDISGGASAEIVGNSLDDAMADPEVHSVILSVDSPGGTVAGTQELAQKVFGYRGVKPMVTYANGTMASAAYWIGAATGELVISGETTIVGSIGVVTTHTDVSKRQEMMGVKTTEISAGKYKRIASQFEPLTKEGKATIQNQVDYLYSVFVNDVATFRGVDVEKVLADMADGRVFIGSQSVQAGLVDGVESLDSVVTRLSTSRNTRNREMAVAGTETTEVTVDVEKLVAAARAEGVAEGRAFELSRIQSLLALSVEGYESIVSAAIADGKSTEGDVALAIVKEQKARGVSLAALQDDAAAAAALPHNVNTEDNAEKKEAELASLIAAGAKGAE